jgi:hypothetical protein
MDGLDTASALVAPVTVQEAKLIHNRMMAYIFSSKYVFNNRRRICD